MQAISKAASLLNISEYRLFDEAYLNWFGDRPKEQDITNVFAQFKMFGEVPIWADEFARGIIDDLEANRQVTLNSFCLLNLAPRLGKKPIITFTLAQEN